MDLPGQKLMQWYCSSVHDGVMQDQGEEGKDGEDRENRRRTEGRSRMLTHQSSPSWLRGRSLQSEVVGAQERRWEGSCKLR